MPWPNFSHSSHLFLHKKTLTGSSVLRSARKKKSFRLEPIKMDVHYLAIQCWATQMCLEFLYHQACFYPASHLSCARFKNDTRSVLLMWKNCQLKCSSHRLHLLFIFYFNFSTQKLLLINLIQNSEEPCLVILLKESLIFFKSCFLVILVAIPQLAIQVSEVKAKLYLCNSWLKRPWQQL